MLNKLIFNDLKRNRIINMCVLLFIAFSAALVSLSTMTAVTSFESIKALYTKAQPAHFIQMHKGALNSVELASFMKKEASNEFWQIVTMVDVFGEAISIQSGERNYDLSDCRIDIGLVKQNAERDLLLDLSHQIVRLKPNEVGIPMLLKEMYNIKIGDQLTIAEGDFSKTFQVKTFILDSQMNSTLVSSTRILFSDQDFDLLANMIGEKEYLIESFFKNPSESTAFKSEYENAKMPQNGQAVTYSIIFILSAFKDMVTVFVMLLISLLLLVVALMSIKYSILASLEEEMTEIGIMKAIGLTHYEIRKIYLGKYFYLSILGALLGFILSLLLGNIVTQGIVNTFGGSGITSGTYMLSLVLETVLLAIILTYCFMVLGKIKKMTVLDTLIFNKSTTTKGKKLRMSISKWADIPLSITMSVRELINNLKNWSIVGSVVIVTTLLVLIPVNLLNTIKAPDFITYMGSSQEDILIEIDGGKDLESNYLDVKNVLSSSEVITSASEFERVRLQTLNSDGERHNLDIDTGMSSGKGIQYLDGDFPKGDNEIAISLLNSQAIGKGVGEQLPIFIDEQEETFTISGVYQDVTSGGYTAKATRKFTNIRANKYWFSIDLNPDIEATKLAKEWSETLSKGIRVDPMQAYIDQTLGGVIKQLKNLNYVIVFIAVSLLVLVATLIMRLTLIKELSEIAVLKAMGFTETDIRKMYVLKVLAISSLGMIVGLAITRLFGSHLVNLFIGLSNLGITRVQLVSNSMIEFILFPIAIGLIMISVTWVITKRVKDFVIVSLIKE